MRERVDAIEALIHRDVGRGVDALFAASRGGLWGAALGLREGPVGIFTGFYVPKAEPPAAETDGPAAAALLALALSRVGVVCRVLTDALCRPACEAALAGAGFSAGAVPVESVRPDDALEPVIDAWRAAGVAWAVAIERGGVSVDGRQRNMRGEDISASMAPLDRVFSAGPWRTIGIGDGGNEVGMGALPAGLVAAEVPFGEQIACVTPADHLIVAGVSHWAAYALIGAWAVVRPDWREAMLSCLDPDLDRRILAGLVADGPAVDGVTLARALTIDGIDLDAHHAVLAVIRALV